MKPKIKNEKRPVSVYLSDDKYKILVKLSDELNLSLTDYLEAAMDLKMKHDNSDVFKESQRLQKYFESRCRELDIAT